MKASQEGWFDVKRCDTTNDTDKPLLKNVLKTVGLLDSASLLHGAFFKRGLSVSFVVSHLFTSNHPSWDAFIHKNN